MIATLLEKVSGPFLEKGPDTFFALSMPSVDNLGKFVVSILAVAGAAFLGGLLIGLVTQFLARMLTTKPMPRAALLFIRVLGGLVTGVLVWMVLFGSGGGGGWGWGGGGNGLGADKGNGSAQDGKDKSGKEDSVSTDKIPPKNGESPSKRTTLRIEVLLPTERCYRLGGEQALRTLPEVGKELERLRKEKPELDKVVIVLYKNSPEQHTVVVRELRTLIENKNLSPTIHLEPGRAP